jgi:hypothetical protein
MSDSFSLYTLLALTGCLITGGLYAWLLYGGSSLLSRNLRYGLAALRTLVVATTIWLLFSPLIKRISYTLEKPIIVIGQDNSLSIKNEPSGFNKLAFQNNMKELAAKLSKDYDVRIYNFSDSVKPGYDFSNRGKLSNASNFFHTLTDGLLNKNVGAVIMATDGIFNRGGNPLYEVSGLKAPVYTIALGDTIPKKDILIANVNYNDLVYLDNEFNVEVQIQAYESQGEVSQLHVLQNGKEVHKEQVQITGNSFVKTALIKLKATKLGLQKYTVSLSPLSNEVTVKNNTQTFLVDVIDDRHKILIAAAAPHPDIAALRQSIELNKHYEVKVAVGEELNTQNYTDYGLIILYQLPAKEFNDSRLLKKILAGKASLWYILGAQSDASKLNLLQSSIRFTPTSDEVKEAYSTVNPAFTPFTLSGEEKKGVARFDPLLVPMGNLQVNVNASTLLFQQAGKVSTDIPQLFFSVDNGKKSAYLIGEGLWRWKLSEARNNVSTEVFTPLISQVVQYLSVKDDKRKFKAYPAKQAFDENEHVLLNAVLYNESYNPVNSPDVNAVLKDQQGKTYNYTFSKQESAYQLDAGLLKAGDYTFTASTRLGSQKYSVKGAFFVKALVAEDLQTIADHQLLYTLSMQTNGKMYRPEDLLNLVKDLGQNEQIKTVSYEDRKYEQLIDIKWLFVLILTLLSLEWFLRKRNGEI